MPTYEYACTECGERLEAVQTFADAPLTECPACGGRLRKVFSPVGVVFKGSGFYKTDSRKPAASSSSNGAAAKPDAKPGASTADSPSSSPSTPSAPAKTSEPSTSQAPSTGSGTAAAS